MSPSQLYRWQAAAGAIVGALVAEVRAVDGSSWAPGGMRSIRVAETMLSGTPLPIDLAPHVAVPAAVGLASGPSPLLADRATIALIDSVRAGLDRDGRLEASEPQIAKAAELARTHAFLDAVDAAGGDPELALLIGAFSGLEGGLGAVPARLASTLRAPDGRHGRRYLCGLTNRLLGVERPNWYDPRRRRGPKEVLPGLWLSNLYGLPGFASEHPDGLVLSLCDDEGRLDGHRRHITFHLEDTPRTDANPSLELVIDEVLTEIADARSAGRPVLVHCRHGASRTGLILRLLLAEELRLSADDAFTEASCLWPHTSTWNEDWTREVRRRAGR